MKSGLGRISESTSKYQGVVVYNMADVPLVIDFFTQNINSDIHFSHIDTRVLELLPSQQQNADMLIP
jgi:ribosome biogenesis protein Nip4